MIQGGGLYVGRGEKAPSVITGSLLRLRKRAWRPLFVETMELRLWTPDGWVRIPRTYTTDFGSIPFFANVLTLGRISPWGPGVLAFKNHDWPYAIGEDGKRGRADDWLKYRLEVDGVDRYDRKVIVESVQRFGAGGYRKAKTWWDTENFTDIETGLAIRPPFPREAAFDGGPWGLRAEPDWPG